MTSVCLFLAANPISNKKLTHLCRVDAATSTIRTGPFAIKGMSSYPHIFFFFFFFLQKSDEDIVNASVRPSPPKPLGGI